jgi:Tfp pilus assembly protein PilE
LGNTIVEAQLNDVKNHLMTIVQIMEKFLNETTLEMLANDSNDSLDYSKRLISQCRKLLVFSEERLDEAQIIIKASPFPKQIAEKTLYKIYHQCIEEFFSPRSDVWFEDSRSAYTGKNAICFRLDVVPSVHQLFRQLEGSFQYLREELEYYETDYKTKLLQSK